MDVSCDLGEQQRILRFWWMLELFSPQQVPKLTPRSTRDADRQVIECSPTMAEAPLPWEALAPPRPLNGTTRVWRHTVYLGVYELEETYESLHKVFRDDEDSYDDRPGRLSACAGLLVDQDGRLIADSAVLSSAMWAVARIHDPGPEDPRWSEGFEQAQKEFADAVHDHEGDRREETGEEEPPVLDSAAMSGLLKIANERAGIGGFSGLDTGRVVIESVAVSASRAKESSENDFLNSFYLDDLAAVQSRVAAEGTRPALARYLTGEDSLATGDRVDVVAEPETVDTGASIDRLPLGRWPSNPEHALALSQQFAVNQALNDLAATRGLMGVNGPPGTGKTTMLRDILAGNVVERARRLAALPKPEDAFTPTTHRWKSGDGYQRYVRQLIPELTGFEMVVASANNAAVENVTTEIPADKAIEHPWRGREDQYFADIATEVLHAGMDNQASRETEPPRAWGLIAARLGNKRNRMSFRDAFWFDKKDSPTKKLADGAGSGMQTWLKQGTPGAEQPKSWAQARDDFTRASRRVETLIDARSQAEKRLRQLSVLLHQEQAHTERVEKLRRDLQQVELDLTRLEPTEQQAQADLTHVNAQYERQLATKPGVLETIFTFGRTMREWRARLGPLIDALHTAEQHQREVNAHGQRLRDQVKQTGIDLSQTQADLSRVQETHAQLRDACEQDRHQYGDGYPDENWVGERRELHAPWLDTELDTARSELFLAALQLHKDFLANAAKDVLPGLRAAVDVVAGTYPHRLEPEKRWAAWQLFFLTVPLVSTTFASLGRMFGDIGPEAIGWLLIDEAGQAPPQYAVGAIWRAQRVVAVGDPLQLQPITTIPNKAQHDIAATYGVSPVWTPPHASVQTLADRVSTYGTILNQGEVWVSAPLRVHRRCDDPMFTLCNQIAYDGIMVNGVHRNLDDPHNPDRFDTVDKPLIAPSSWFNKSADTAGTHLQENQIDKLELLLADLADHGVPPSDVIAISPFRAVADRLATLADSSPGASYSGMRAGTIHTAQGREAPVVVLVLGGDPNSPGAKSWAASSVNLINVAASRAQRRLYVIGDRKSWAEHNYFYQLSNALPLANDH